MLPKGDGASGVAQFAHRQQVVGDAGATVSASCPLGETVEEQLERARGSHVRAVGDEKHFGCFLDGGELRFCIVAEEGDGCRRVDERGLGNVGGVASAKGGKTMAFV